MSKTTAAGNNNGYNRHWRETDSELANWMLNCSTWLVWRTDCFRIPVSLENVLHSPSHITFLWMSQLMRLWHFLSSVNSFFKRACAANQWGWMSDFVYFHTSYVRTAKVLARLRGCAGSPEPSLVACVISTIISWTDSYYISIKFLMVIHISFEMSAFW